MSSTLSRKLRRIPLQTQLFPTDRTKLAYQTEEEIEWARTLAIRNWRKARRERTQKSKAK